MSPVDDDLFSYIDIQRYNPWWESKENLPSAELSRADLYWRVRNTLDNNVLLIPGAAATGTNTTLKQIVRALVEGSDHENERIRQLFQNEESPENVVTDGYDPAQICYVSCSDPLAHLVEGFIDRVRQKYHPRGARTGERDFYLFLADVHRLDDWQSQLSEAYTRVTRDFPEENWTFIASMPVARLADESSFEDVEGVDIDLPHHTQKYRDTLFTRAPGLQATLRQPHRGEDSTDEIERARRLLSDAATGECPASELRDVFETIEAQLRTKFPDGRLEQVSEEFLTEGGFAPALDASQTQEQPYPVAAETVEAHLTNSLANTIYQDIPRLAKLERDIPRIEAPEDLHGLITFIARREFTETTYIDLGERLSCDTRTIRQKFVPILERLHIGERSTRYDLKRNRTLRFYLRTPGYLTAFRGQSVTEEDLTDRIRVLLADHLRRLLANIGDETLLQYWRDEDHLVDYIFDVDGNPVLFASAFADNTGGTVDAFEGFAESVSEHHLEIRIADLSTNIEVERVGSDRLRLTLPHWVLLAIC